MTQNTQLPLSQRILNRIVTKPGYKYLGVLMFFMFILYMFSLTSFTVYVNTDGEIYKVDNRYLETPTKHYELFKEATTIVYDKEI